MSSVASKIKSFTDSELVNAAEFWIEYNRYITVGGRHYHTTGAYTLSKSLALKFSVHLRAVGYTTRMRKRVTGYEVFIARGRWAQHRYEQRRGK